MTIFLRRLKIRDFNPVSDIPNYPSGSWKVYSICEVNDIATCTTLSDIRALDSEDKRQARASFMHFLNRTNTGQPIQELYDEKQCHPTHTFKINSHDRKVVTIWRVRIAGALRINFIYLPDKSIVILKTWAKRKDKLSNGDELQLETIALQVLKSSTFTYIPN